MRCPIRWRSRAAGAWPGQGVMSRTRFEAKASPRCVVFSETLYI